MSRSSWRCSGPGTGSNFGQRRRDGKAISIAGDPNFVCKLSRRRNELCESSGLGNGGGDVVAAVAVVVAEDVVVVVAAADVVAMVTGEALSMICPESERKF